MVSCILYAPNRRAAVFYGCCTKEPVYRDRYGWDRGSTVGSSGRGQAFGGRKWESDREEGEKLFRLFGHQVRRSVWRSFRRPRRRGVRVVKEGLYPEMADRKKKKVGRRTGEGIFVLYRDRRRGDLFWRLDLPSVTTIPPPSCAVVDFSASFPPPIYGVYTPFALLQDKCLFLRCSTIERKEGNLF